MAELRHPQTGDFWGECSAYATGAVVRQSNKRPFEEAEPVQDMHLSALQMRKRDSSVQIRVEGITHRYNRNLISKDNAQKKIEGVWSATGSKGQTEHDKSGLGYWCVRMCSRLAPYHCMQLGVGKNFLAWLLVRLGAREAPKDPLIMPFKRPKDVRRLLQARRNHFVLRNKPDCIMVDFSQHLGSMTMSELQLLYEVGVPYYCHDLVSFGVPQEAVVMWLLLRHGMLLLTRLTAADTDEGYRDQLREARACLFAYAATAEYLHSKSATDPGLNQFWFTWKLHVLVAHLLCQALDSGHPVQCNDSWVEQLMRHKACQVCKCAPLTATLRSRDIPHLVASLPVLPARYCHCIIVTERESGLAPSHARQQTGACAGTGHRKTPRTPFSSPTKTTTAQKQWR